MKKEKAKSTIIVTIEDMCYTWNGNLWYGPDFIKPPSMIIAQLNEFMKTNSKAVDVARPVKRFPPMSTTKKTIKKKAVKKVIRKVKTNHGKIGKKLAKKDLTNASNHRQTAKIYTKKGNVPLKMKKVQVKKVKYKK